MPKLPNEEDAMWALAYSLATAVLTLGASIHSGVSAEKPNAAMIDVRAKEIADNATREIKKRKVI